MAVQHNLRKSASHAVDYLQSAGANYEEGIFYSELYNILTMVTSVNVY